MIWILGWWELDVNYPIINLLRPLTPYNPPYKCLKVRFMNKRMYGIGTPRKRCWATDSLPFIGSRKLNNLWLTFLRFQNVQRVASSLAHRTQVKPEKKKLKKWKRLSIHAPPAPGIFKVLLPKWRHLVTLHDGVTSSYDITRRPDITRYARVLHYVFQIKKMQLDVGSEPTLRFAYVTCITRDKISEKFILHIWHIDKISLQCSNP